MIKLPPIISTELISIITTSDLWSGMLDLGVSRSQTMTIEVLHKALDRLAKYYDLVQTAGSSWIQRQTPDVVQMEYKKSKGATGVMEMIEKLIYDARELMANSKAAESDAQAAYEKLVADSNASVKAL